MPPYSLLNLGPLINVTTNRSLPMDKPATSPQCRATVPLPSSSLEFQISPGRLQLYNSLVLPSVRITSSSLTSHRLLCRPSPDAVGLCRTLSDFVKLTNDPPFLVSSIVAHTDGFTVMLHTVSGDVLLRRFLNRAEQWNMTLGRSLSPGGGMVFSEKTGLYGVYFGISGTFFPIVTRSML